MKVIDVPYINQSEKWPVGCESVCSAMVLRYWGFDADPDKFIDDFLIKGAAPHGDGNGGLTGADPYKAFPGDPRAKEGFGCMSNVIEFSMRDAMKYYEPDGKPRVLRLKGFPLQRLTELYTDKDIPVLVWATIGMKPLEEKPEAVWTADDGSGKVIEWKTPEHCLVLVGHDDENFIFNDPIAGEKVSYPKEAADAAFIAMGRQAVVVAAKEDEQ
jgi:uncharacterized protein YvpB